MGMNKIEMYYLYACLEPYEFAIILLVGMQLRQKWGELKKFASFNVFI
jgi:hypothetical protein